MTQGRGSARHGKRRRREIKWAAQLTVERFGREFRRGGAWSPGQRSWGAPWVHSGSLAVRCRAWEAVAWPVCGGAGRSARRSRAAGWVSGSGWRGTESGVQMRYAGANYRQGRGFGRACSRKEVRRGSRAQRGEGGSRATELRDLGPGVDASRRVGRRYG